MDYELEADWKLLNGCNYRCSYCFFTAESLGRKLVGLPSSSEWIEAFAATGRTWLLHMTGGEPTLYPGFVDLCVGLAEHHYLSLNTNLTRPSVAEFGKRVDPGRVSIVHAALHPAERERRDGWAAFATNLEILAAHGQPVLVSVVATPDALARFGDIARELEPTGFRPVPKLLRGDHDGSRYPAAYSQADRARFRAASAWAREGYAGLEAGRAETPTVWPLYDDRKLDGAIPYLGNDCDAGRRFVAIHPDGSVYRCSTRTPLGNILSGDVALFDKARACDTSYCSYFCDKYVRGQYFNLGSTGALTTYN